MTRTQGSWPLRDEVDCYGNVLEAELGQFLTMAEMEQVTRSLERDFPWTGPNEFASGPSAIPDPNDFSAIVAFAMSGDGALFCLDYRDGGEPRIIWWDDTHWRCVAPSIDAFLRLFKLHLA